MPELHRLGCLLLVAALAGCSDEEARLRHWQQTQVDQLQRQSQENSAASRALVEADAAARREFVALEQAVQAERQELAAQYTALEADRRSLAAARERLPLLVTAFQGLAALALGTAALWVCVRLLGASQDDGAAELEQTLVLSITGVENPFAELPPPLQPRPSIRAVAPASTDAGESPPIDE